MAREGGAQIEGAQQKLANARMLGTCRSYGRPSAYQGSERAPDSNVSIEGVEDQQCRGPRADFFAGFDPPPGIRWSDSAIHPAARRVHRALRLILRDVAFKVADCCPCFPEKLVGSSRFLMVGEVWRSGGLGGRSRAMTRARFC